MKSDPRMPVRAGRLLRVRALWLIPLVLGSAVVAAMTALYISSVSDPLAHLSGLPVALVNQDRGATAGSQHVAFGAQIESGLLASPAVSGRLRLEVSTLSQAQQAMNNDDVYAMLVIPPRFTADLLAVAGLGGAGAGSSPAPTTPSAPGIAILTNERAGTVGTQLATGILQPALAAASHRIGARLAALVAAVPAVPSGAQSTATKLYLADPIAVHIAPYNPLPENAALGLSAFYVALLTMLAGFLGATIVNSAVDSALGYATNEVGPRWRQRRPLRINRSQTLLIKWPLVTILTAVMTVVVLLVATAGLGMDAPYPALLWVYLWLCAASVGIGTIALFAAAGTYGQLIALLLFVYAGLASAGGTVPVQALPGPLRFLSNFEPLRQILLGTRSIMYFGARADAGLVRGTVAAGLGLLFWLVLGAAIVAWYDHKRYYRLDPDIIASVDAAIADHEARQAAKGNAAE